MSPRPRSLLTGTLVAGLLFTTGCGSSDSTRKDASAPLGVSGGAALPGAPADQGPPPLSGNAPPPPAGTAPTGQPPTGGAPATGSGQLTMRQDAALGTVVADAQGFTLYRFDKDTPQPPSSTCTGGCAQTWPPVPASAAAAQAPSGIGPLGQVQRDDGTMQLTLGGWPVYRYSQDTAPGETKGQGVSNGAWNALAPNGTKAGPGQGAARNGGKGQNGSRRQDRGQGTGGNGALTVIVQPVLGSVIVDGSGRLLYRRGDGFRGNPLDCDDRCRRTWTRVPAIDRSRVRGINPALVSSIQLSDGFSQLLLNGQPVFWFNDDRTSQDIAGQGRDGFWSLAADGRLNQTAPRGGDRR